MTAAQAEPAHMPDLSTRLHRSLFSARQWSGMQPTRMQAHIQSPVEAGGQRHRFALRCWQQLPKHCKDMLLRCIAVALGQLLEACLRRGARLGGRTLTVRLAQLDTSGAAHSHVTAVARGRTTADGWQGRSKASRAGVIWGSGRLHPLRQRSPGGEGCWQPVRG